MTGLWLTISSLAGFATGIKSSRHLAIWLGNSDKLLVTEIAIALEDACPQ
ncbi:hypothetical protein H6G41_32105 [Tolypothrix sp. FACHB-123]|nr:hypothetical protein [Tolypothrix sp. FACHB-123]MBD2359175.1 hypothetical protein [Tolypothrix sp. FACHB-123]